MKKLTARDYDIMIQAVSHARNTIEAVVSDPFIGMSNVDADILEDYFALNRLAVKYRKLMEGQERDTK